MTPWIPYLRPKHVSLVFAALLALGACSGSPDRVYDATIIRPEVIAHLEEPDSTFSLAWIRETGAVPETDSFREYVKNASDEEIETAASGACEAYEFAQTVELSFVRGDVDNVIGGAYDEWEDDQLERNQILSDDQTSISLLHLMAAFTEAACPEVGQDEPS